jgi:hypothetical protein
VIRQWPSSFPPSKCRSPTFPPPGCFLFARSPMVFTHMLLFSIFALLCSHVYPSIDDTSDERKLAATMQHSPHIICNSHMHNRHVVCSFVLVVILGTKCTKNKVQAWNNEFCTDVHVAAWEAMCRSQSRRDTVAHQGRGQKAIMKVE